MSTEVVVSLFCGGRGCAALVRELTRRVHVRLNLLINAYDDGLSTGEIRNFIPGMLGPSDFRKNLSYLLDLHSDEQYALANVLEYRLSTPFDDRAVNDFRLAFLDPNAVARSEPKLAEILQSVGGQMLAKLRDLVFTFLDYSGQQARHFNFADCSVGNLLFAGAYIRSGGSFNRATSELATLFGSQASLINVTSGENRILAGLTEDGALLEREARIVGQHGPGKIDEVFLLERGLNADEIARISTLPLTERRAFLRAREAPVRISPEADHALRQSDIIIYGSGTQHSSLLPSYKTLGVREAILESRARAKVFIVNIHEDHDIKGLTVSELVDRALYYLGDNNENGRAITHILSSNGGASPQKALHDDVTSETYRYARMMRAPLESPAAAGTHSGNRTASEILALFHNVDTRSSGELEIFVDLSRRSLALPYLLQELSEIDWRARFSHVTVTVNAASLPDLKCPAHITLRASGEVRDTSHCDMAVVHQWLQQGSSTYLVTLTGDGEYRMADVLPAIQVCEEHAFGAVYGSRTQSRRQLLASLRATYAESRSLFFLSWCANFLLALLYGLRFQVIFSDPLTGFRVYRREALHSVELASGRRPWLSGAGLTKVLLAHHIEISEIPVSYRAYRGFTNVNWRIKRGLQHALSLIS